MVQKSSILIPSNKCGVWSVRVFHTYRGWNRKVAYTGDFVKTSVQSTQPENWLKKKTKVKGFLVRAVKRTLKKDGSCFYFNSNSCMLLKKRMTPYGKEFFGPTLKSIKRKKFLATFPGVI